MRSQSSLPSGRHSKASSAGDAPRPPRRTRVLRAVGHAAVILALVGATGVFAAASGPAPGSAASAGGAELADGAAVEPTGSASVPRGASRDLERRPLVRDVAIVADGVSRTLQTSAETVADVLDEAGLVLGPEDEVGVPLDVVPADGATIAIARVTFLETTERSEIPFETTERRDGTLASGKREVEVAGEAGTQTVAYRIRLVDGVEVGREEVLRTVIEPVAEVVRVGTRAQASAGTFVPGPVYEGDPRSIGRSLVAARGWGEDQWVCLDALFTRESNWNPSAQNPSSGAYGIPQALPGSKMATVASDWRTNPATQITWGLNYIASRYGTPCGAWSHSQSTGWY